MSEANKASSATTALIQDAKSLTALCESLRDGPWMALDTEFMRTRTYYARLCLVQVATPASIACVDTLALQSIEPLLEVIYSPSVLKVIHAARQDLEVFAQHLVLNTDVHPDSALYPRKVLGAPPAPVFDTQIAASLCGYEDQIGYGTLVESITGHKLPKLHTRADWEVRPLPPDQLHYAEDDVRYLRDVHQFLAQKLEALGRTDWLQEECATLTRPALYRNDPREAYRRLKQGQSLPPAAQVILRELAAWREHTAQQNNLPRGWVVPDAALVETALTAPASLEVLGQISGMSGSAVRKWGEEILQTIERGRREKPARLWEEPQRLDRRQQALYEQLQVRVRAVAEQVKISATLLAPRRELLKILAGDTSGSLTRGWRQVLIGDELLRLCGHQTDVTTS